MFTWYKILNINSLWAFLFSIVAKHNKLNNVRFCLQMLWMGGTDIILPFTYKDGITAFKVLCNCVWLLQILECNLIFMISLTQSLRWCACSVHVVFQICMAILMSQVLKNNWIITIKKQPNLSTVHHIKSCNDKLLIMN